MVVGARSALFLPYRDLGLIVVDEAHEASFKQEDGVQYHARDVAVMRGQVRGRPGHPRLGDAGDRDAATWSRSAAIAKLKLPDRYRRRAPARHRRARPASQDPPPRGRWLAPELVEALEDNLEARRAVACCSSTAAATRR